MQHKDMTWGVQCIMGYVVSSAALLLQPSSGPYNYKLKLRVDYYFFNLTSVSSSFWIRDSHFICEITKTYIELKAENVCVFGENKQNLFR